MNKKNPYYTKVNSKEKVMKALKEQRGRYADTFELWNAKQLELVQKREDAKIEYAKNKLKDPNASRGPNKTDFYEKI